MNELTVAGFRCFYEEQTVRLAPLTILVGENSTGKTSFLALVRALWDVAFLEKLPDFKAPPYDLGSFDEVAHYRGGRGGRASSFTAGFSMGTPGRKHPARANTKMTPSRYHVTFRRDDSGVFPGVRRVENGSTWVECRFTNDGIVSFIVATSNGQWTVNPHLLGATESFASSPGWAGPQHDLIPLGYLIHMFLRVVHSKLDHLEHSAETEQPPNNQDLEEITRLYKYKERRLARPYASAPVRSRLRRTYDPSQAIPDPEGGTFPCCSRP